VRFDKIKTVEHVTMRRSDAITYLNAVRQSIKVLGDYPTGESVASLMFRIPIGDASRPHLDADVDLNAAYVAITGEGDKAESDSDGGTGGRSSHFDVAGIPSDITTIEDMMEFLKRPGEARNKAWKYWHTAVSLSKRLSGARFCTTEKGYAGLVPFDAAPGQEICIVHGVGAPLVVRSRCGTEGYDELVGECYIHGIMYGEALDDTPPETYINLV
jgi:hypothetical protein